MSYCLFLWDFIFSCPLYFFPCSCISLYLIFLCLISFLLFPCECAWELIVQELIISGSHTEWYFLFFWQCIYKCTKENSVRVGNTSPSTSNPVSTKLNSVYRLAALLAWPDTVLTCMQTGSMTCLTWHCTHLYADWQHDLPDLTLYSPVCRLAAWLAWPDTVLTCMQTGSMTCLTWHCSPVYI